MRSSRWDDLNEKDEMVRWMKDLLLAHPVLRRLPEHIQKRLVVEPNGWGAIPGNSRSRKRLRRTGITLHLYAGPEKGFTLSRAMRQVAGSEACEELLEIDILRGDSHDMMSDHGVFFLVAGRLGGQDQCSDCRSKLQNPVYAETSTPPERKTEAGEGLGR